MDPTKLSRSRPLGAPTVLALMMESSVWQAWETAILSAVGPEAWSLSPSLLIRAVAVAGGFLVAETLHRRKAGIGTLRLLTLLSGMTSASILAAASGASLVTFAVSLFMWWRGAIVAQYHHSHGSLAEQFQNLSLGLVVLVLLFGTLGVPDAAVPSVGAWVGCFFASGLLALSTASMQMVALQAADIEQAVGGCNSAWRRFTVAGALGVVAVPALIAWLVAGRHISLTGALLKGLLLKLSEVLAFIFTPLAMLIGIVLEPIARLLMRRAARLPENIPGTQLEGEGVQGALKGLPPWVVATIVVLAVAGVALLVLTVFISSLWLRGDPDEEGFSETRESIWPWRGAVSPRRKVAPAGGVAGGGDPGRDSPARRAYRRLLALGAARHTARQPCETPYEYLPRLMSALVAAAPVRSAAQLITKAYVHARYGDAPTAEGESRVLEESVREIEAAVGVPLEVSAMHRPHPARGERISLDAALTRRRRSDELGG